MVSSLSHRFHEHTCKQVSYLAVQFGRRDTEAGVCSPRAWLNTTLHSIHEVDRDNSVLCAGPRTKVFMCFTVFNMFHVADLIETLKPRGYTICSM